MVSSGILRYLKFMLGLRSSHRECVHIHKLKNTIINVLRASVKEIVGFSHLKDDSVRPEGGCVTAASFEYHVLQFPRLLTYGQHLACDRLQ